MREMSVAEQRYRAVLAVISDGRTVHEVAAAVGVSASDAGGYRGGGVGGAPGASVVGAAADCCGDQSTARCRVGDRVVGVSMFAAGRADRTRRTSPAAPGLETMGTRPGERVVADGHRGRVSAGRR